MKWAIAALLSSAAVLGQQQPIPFSHKLHSEKALKCQDCHPNPAPGRAMSSPEAPKCMVCHGIIATEKPSISKLAEIAKSGKPAGWVRIYKLPDFVTWSHKPHLKLKCDDCHGNVGQMETMTLQANAVKMSGCLDCHRLKKATLECSSCHDLN